jgi:hypothetical protein
MRWSKRVQYQLADDGWSPIKPHEMTRRSWRRHQTERHMWRRLKEDRNQHYDDLNCPCWVKGKAMARFKEQPKLCGNSCCGNPRRHYGWPAWSVLTIQERKAADAAAIPAEESCLHPREIEQLFGNPEKFKEEVA